MVVAKDRSIFRFSSTSAMFLLSPFNPIRRIAIFILTHPYPFSLFTFAASLANSDVLGYMGKKTLTVLKTWHVMSTKTDQGKLAKHVHTVCV